jgi:hypothetical protein
MTAVTVIRQGTRYEVARVFESLPAAMAGVAALGDIPERAYTAPELTPAQQALAERQDEDAPLEGLKAGEVGREHDAAAYAHAINNLPDEE